jgi:hypothetical protein
LSLFLFKSIYNKNKTMIKQNWCISSEEKNRIINLHESATKRLYLSEDDKPSTSSDEMALKGESFFANGMWKNLSPKGKEQLDSQLASAAKFLAAKKGRVVYVKIIAGESQVTNTDNENSNHPKVDPGYLSGKRAETMKTYLTRYFDNLLSQGIISSKPIFEAPEVIIGSNTYTKGVDNPNDPKYKDERFVNVELKLQSPEKCVVGLTVEVMYNKDPNPAFPCRGGHTCDEAKFAVKLNGVNIGTADLNNRKDGGSRTSGKIVITDAQAKQIIGNQSKDIVISLQCLSGANCHSSTPEVKITKGSTVIYWGCSPSINARGETNEKIILVLDNCGNLKKKGTETENKGEGTNKRLSDSQTPKSTGKKVVEYAVGVDGDIVVTRDKLVKNGWIGVQQDGSYIALKDMVPVGVKSGDKIKFVKKEVPKATTNANEKVPANAQIITVKTVNGDTLQVAAKKFVDNKFAVMTDKPNVLKIVKDIGYNEVMYKPNQYINLIQG